MRKYHIIYKLYQRRISFLSSDKIEIQIPLLLNSANKIYYDFFIHYFLLMLILAKNWQKNQKSFEYFEFPKNC